MEKMRQRRANGSSIACRRLLPQGPRAGGFVLAPAMVVAWSVAVAVAVAGHL
jgi:hypothetical protein